MKNYALFILVLIAFGCQKKTDKDDSFHPAYPNHYGTIKAVRNGRPFSGKVYANAILDNNGNGKIGLAIDDFRENFYWDQITIANIPLKLSYQQFWGDTMDYSTRRYTNILPFCKYNGSFDYGSDAVSPNHLDTTFPHFISISKYDATTKEIWGTFEFTFVKDHPTSLKPDAVRYSNGEFYTKIQ